MIDVYTAAVFQPVIWGCRNRADVQINLDRIIETVSSPASWYYVQHNAAGGQQYPPGKGTWAPLKLVVLPELALNTPAYLADAPVEKLIDEICIDIPGPEVQALGALCRSNNYYMSCGAYERHSEFPGVIFSSTFILDPTGKVVHVHRKYNTWIPSEAIGTSPHDVFDKYVDVFGSGKSLVQTFFPVVDTEIGRLGVVNSNDGLYPENWRALGLQGAEVLLTGNLVEGAGSPYEWREILGRAGALQNTAYVISAGWGVKRNHPTPEYSSGGTGGSFVADYEGKIIGQCRFPGEAMTSGVISIDHLRRRRADPGSFNLFGHLRTEPYGELYREPIYPKNVLLDEPLAHGKDVWRRDIVNLGVVDRLVKRGILQTQYTDRSGFDNSKGRR